MSELTPRWATKLAQLKTKVANQASDLVGKFRHWQSKTWVAEGTKTAAIIIVVVNAIFGLLEKRDDAVRWLGWDRCHVIDPFTKKRNPYFSDRPCLSGRITLVKWLYPQVAGAATVIDRLNRTFQVVRVDGDHVEWGEQSLLYIDGHGKEVWSPIVLYYMAVQGGELVPAAEVLAGNNPYQGDGFIIRQIAISSNSCTPKGGPKPAWAQPNQLQFFIPNSLPRATKPISVESLNGVQDSKTIDIYDRQTPLVCGEQMGDGFQIGPYFNDSYPLGFIARDP